MMPIPNWLALLFQKRLKTFLQAHRHTSNKKYGDYKKVSADQYGRERYFLQENERRAHEITIQKKTVHQSLTVFFILQQTVQKNNNSKANL